MGRPNHTAPDLWLGGAQHVVHCAPLAQRNSRVENKLGAVAVSDGACHGPMVAQWSSFTSQPTSQAVAAGQFVTASVGLS